MLREMPPRLYRCVCPAPSAGTPSRRGTRKRTERKRTERPIFDESGDLLQHLAGQCLITRENRIHGDDMKRRIATQRPKRDSSILIDVAFADFNEATEFCQT